MWRSLRNRMDVVRICSYNVRRFTGNDGSNTVQSIANALKQLRIQPSIICLNEVDLHKFPDALEQLVESLRTKDIEYSYSFFGHVQGKYGNALLTSSAFEVLGTNDTQLRGGTEIVFPSGTKRLGGQVVEEQEKHRIIRGLLEVQIRPKLRPDLGLSVFCTHLDHISEEQRKEQLEHIAEVLKPGLILGDMNALKRKDYSAEEWGALEQRHEERQWSAPQSGCLDVLHRCGWIDCQEVFHEELCQTPLNEVKTEDKCTAHEHYRIDYCFAHRSLLESFKVINAFVYKDCTYSDHLPLCVDLEMTPHPQTRI